MADEVKYPFGREFQLATVALMLQDAKFLTFARGLVKPESFEGAEFSTIVQTIFSLYDTYHAPVPVNAVLATLEGRQKREDISIYRKILGELPSVIEEVEHGVIRTELGRFARHAEIRRALKQSMDLVYADKLDEIEGLFRKALSVGAELEDIGTFYFKDVQRRVQFRRQAFDNAVRLFIPEIDETLLGHGLIPGDVGIVIAPTGRGKTFFLLHAVRSALIQRKKVVVYTLEMSEDLIGTRLDAANTGILTRELFVDMQETNELLTSTLTRMAKMYGEESLLIKYLPLMANPTVDTIQTHLRQCHGIGFIPGLVVIDYGDLLRGRGNFKGDSTAEQKAVYNDIKGLMVETGLACWAASQGNRGSVHKESVEMDDAGGAYSKFQIIDFALALNQTEVEYLAKTMRIKIIKNRNEKSKLIVTVKTDFAHGLFYKVE